MTSQFERAGEIGQLGLVVIADSAPPRGAKVQLIIEIQKRGSFASRLVGRGEVLRSMDMSGGPHSFAVKACSAWRVCCVEGLIGSLSRPFCRKPRIPRNACISFAAFYRQTAIGRNSSASPANPVCNIASTRAVPVTNTFHL